MALGKDAFLPTCCSYSELSRKDCPVVLAAWWKSACGQTKKLPCGSRERCISPGCPLLAECQRHFCTFYWPLLSLGCQHNSKDAAASFQGMRVTGEVAESKEQSTEKWTVSSLMTRCVGQLCCMPSSKGRWAPNDPRSRHGMVTAHRHRHPPRAKPTSTRRKPRKL